MVFSRWEFIRKHPQSVQLRGNKESGIGKRGRLGCNTVATKVLATHSWYGPLELAHLNASFYAPTIDQLLDTDNLLEGCSLQLRSFKGGTNMAVGGMNTSDPRGRLEA